jgi:hypothetical protein
MLAGDPLRNGWRDEHVKEALGLARRQLRQILDVLRDDIRAGTSIVATARRARGPPPP